jgi:hypothetical protein
MRHCKGLHKAIGQTAAGDEMFRGIKLLGVFIREDKCLHALSTLEIAEHSERFSSCVV